MIYTTDDLCLEYLSEFFRFDTIKKEFPEFKLVAFTIANFKNHENLLGSTTFQNWFARHKNWVEIAVHSYDHLPPPDGDRPDEENWIAKALKNLKPYLPSNYGYRSPGWQTTNKTESILRDLGFSYIAYESKIKRFNNEIETGIVNSHLYDLESINKLYEVFKNQH